MGYESTDAKMDIELTVIECTICFVNEQNTFLPCTHKVCESCYEKIDECPFCRNKINKPITHILVTNEDPNHDTKFYIFLFFVCAVPISFLFYGMIIFSRPR